MTKTTTRCDTTINKKRRGSGCNTTINNARIGSSGGGGGGVGEWNTRGTATDDDKQLDVIILCIAIITT